MASALIMVILLIVMIVLNCLIATFATLVVAMPYVTGFVGTLFLTLAYPPLTELIPGHPKLSVFSVAVLVEIVIYLLLRYEQTSKPTIIFTSSLLINFVALLVLSGMVIDSYQLGIFVTIVYLVGTIFFMRTNLNSQETERRTRRNIILSIFAGILYAMSVGVTLFMLLGGIWIRYIKYLGDEELYDRFDKISIIAIIAAMIITCIASIVKNLIEEHYVTIDFIQVDDLDEIQ